MSTERQLRNNVQLTYKPHTPRRPMSPTRVGIFIAALLAVSSLVAAVVLNVAMRGVS